MFSFRKKPKPSPASPNLAAIADNALTIVIPSKGRPRQLRALLSYYNAKRVKHPILILLSGKRREYLPDEYPALHLEVKEYPDNTSFHGKIKDGVNQVTTPLTALCTDDDIVLADAIEAAEKFLTANPDYSACQGYHALFSSNKKITNLVSIAWFTPSLNSSNPLERLKALVLRYQPICWAVFRTDCMKAIVQNFTPELNFFFQEMLWSCTAALTGKVKRMPMVYCLRQIDPIHLMGHPIFAMMESPQRFFQEYLVYRALIVGQLVPHSRIPRDALERLVDLMHISYFSRETEMSLWNYFIDQAMANPSVSIHQPPVSNVLTPRAPSVEAGWEKEVEVQGQKYRLFPQMLRPEPKEEIHLTQGYESELIKDIAHYFSADKTTS